MNLSDGMLSAIGQTPLVRLGNLFRDCTFDVYAKMELLNPGGSSKDRPALGMIKEAWKEGRIGPGSVVVESSSGNMAVSLAMICRVLGMRFICVVDARTTAVHLRLLNLYGAEIDRVTRPDPETGEFLPARLKRVQQLIDTIPGAFWPNQYENPNNYLAHCHTTMQEIVEELGRVDYLFAAASTCGTIRGCAEHVKTRGLSTRIVAVDASGSAIFGGNGKERRFPGLGAGIVPPFYQPDLADRVVHVSDREIVSGCLALAREEAILAGASSGAVIAAVRHMAREFAPGTRCAVILHDRGERYVDTVFNEEWVNREIGGS